MASLVAGAAGMIGQSVKSRHGRARYRLLALDLDGTVIGPDREVSSATLAALAEFQAAGGRITIATGRTFRSTRPFAEQLNVDVPIICYQGALIRDHRDGATLFHATLPADLAAEASAKLLHAGIYVQAYIDDDLFVPYEGDETRWYLSYSAAPLPVTVVGDLPAFLLDRAPTSLLFIAAERDVAIHVKGLAASFGTRLNVARSHAFFGELTAPGCTKGQALEKVAQVLNIPWDAVAAAGDQGSDLDMVARAGLGMAVAGGPPELQAVADVVIGGPAAGGLSDAIRRYLLAERCA